MIWKGLCVAMIVVNKETNEIWLGYDLVVPSWVEQVIVLEQFRCKSSILIVQHFFCNLFVSFEMFKWVKMEID